MSRWEQRQRIAARLAAETGTLRKQGAGRRLALCYASPYPVAMSSLGFQTIYREVNARPDWAAERAFLPDAEELEAADRTPLCTYESETPVGDYAALAFSIAYELELADLGRFLDLAGVPAARTERGGNHPLLVCGGPLTFANAAPLGAFADVVVVGEAEAALDLLLAALALLPDREAALAAVRGQPGFWLPGDGGRPGERLCARPDQLPAYAQITTPDSELPDMFLVEAERGCSRGCAYCVMRRESSGGMRAPAPEAVLGRIPAHARRVGLVGAAVTDHPRVRDIIRALVDGGREVGVSSLRADRLDAELVDLLARGGQRTLTVASDGASERLREALGRHTSAAHLLRAAELCRAAGMRRIKLYQLIGVPGEEDADLDELGAFVRELAQIAPVAVAVSPLVPKLQTPLADAPFGPIPLLEAKLKRVRRAIGTVAEVRATSPRTAWIEYCLAQGGEAAGHAALAAGRA
ncbi:MAG TPA: radical SAM protein, partial [Polyangia bacterium]